MSNLSRRSVLRGSMYLAAGAALTRPYIANAAATTATVWWGQGFAQEEDVAFRKMVADYEKASGNKIDYSIIPYAPQRQKIVSAITSGDVPDVIPANPAEIVALYAWQNKLTDVTDVVETQMSRIQRHGAALRPVLQRCDQTAQLLWRAVHRGNAAQPHLEVAGGEGRLQDRGHS